MQNKIKHTHHQVPEQTSFALVPGRYLHEEQMQDDMFSWVLSIDDRHHQKVGLTFLYFVLLVPANTANEDSNVSEMNQNVLLVHLPASDAPQQNNESTVLQNKESTKGEKIWSKYVTSQIVYFEST